MACIEKEHPTLSVTRQAALLGISRSSVYYQPVDQGNAEGLALMRVIDEQYTKTPFYGARRMRAVLQRHGYVIGRKRVRKLMRQMGLEAIYPRPNTSQRHPEHLIFPYLLRGLKISRPNQVWGADITYIRLVRGWMYLMAILDWYSRYVVSWSVSTSLDVDFCLEALENALQMGKPDIFNTDQGSQFTSTIFTGVLKANEIRISMDGRGRAFDNIFTERLWRSVKYEEVYLNEYQSVREGKGRLAQSLDFYNQERLHQSLEYQTPAEVYF